MQIPGSDYGVTTRRQRLQRGTSIKAPPEPSQCFRTIQLTYLQFADLDCIHQLSTTYPGQLHLQIKNNIKLLHV